MTGISFAVPLSKSTLEAHREIRENGKGLNARLLSVLASLIIVSPTIGNWVLEQWERRNPYFTTIIRRGGGRRGTTNAAAAHARESSAARCARARRQQQHPSSHAAPSSRPQVPSPRRRRIIRILRAVGTILMHLCRNPNQQLPSAPAVDEPPSRPPFLELSGMVLGM